MSAPSGGRALTTGPGRVLVSLYALFALAAGARAAVQIATKFDEAPLAYMLSAVAAVIYLVATVGFIRGGRAAGGWPSSAAPSNWWGCWRSARPAWSRRRRSRTPRVWSGFGRGYGFVPLVLPVLGLLWLRSDAERITPT